MGRGKGGRGGRVKEATEGGGKGYIRKTRHLLLPTVSTSTIPFRYVCNFLQFLFGPSSKPK